MTRNANVSEYGSEMSDQIAHPGYYSCHLNSYNIHTEVSATERSGISRFTFPAGKSNILLDLGNGLTNESGASVKIVNNREIEGWRMTGTFCYNNGTERPVYFVARFSKPAESFGAWKKMPELGSEAAWSNTSGNAWLMEISESDMVQVADNGKPLEFPIDENPETIEINWTQFFTPIS